MDEAQEKLYDLAEGITERVMGILAPDTPVMVSDGGDDANSLTYTEEARTVYENVLDVLEGEQR